MQILAINERLTTSVKIKKKHVTLSGNPSFLNFSPFQWRSTTSNTQVVEV